MDRGKRRHSGSFSGLPASICFFARRQDGLANVRNRQDFIGKAFGGWQLNGIVTASSGFPWTPVYSNPAAGCVTVTDRGAVCPLRPIGYRGGLEQDTSNAGFQRGTFGPGAAQFFVPPPGGTTSLPPPPGIGRNVFRGPGYFNVDLSVVKRIGMPKFMRLGEQAGIDLRANAFNVFNNLNLEPFGFNSAPTQINSVEFGRAQRALQGRVVEFQARFSF